MQIRSQKRSGSTMMVVLFFCIAIGIVMASLLKLTSVRYTNTIRSMDWNSVIPVAEAGVEDAMTHLHQDTTPGSNTWTLGTYNGVAAYTKQRTFTDGSYYFVAIVNATTTAPTIYSQGYVRAPFKNSRYIGRTLRVQLTTGGTSLFTKAILARGTINFAGDMQVNSYDSSNPSYSNPDGTYNTNKYLSNGWIASMSTSGTAIDLAGALVYGGIQYNAGATYNLGSGIVGDSSFVNNSADAGKIEAGYNDNTLNVSVPATPMPTNSSGTTVDPSTWTYVAPLAHAFTTNGVTYDYVLTSGDWSIGSDTFHNQNILVTGNARLYVGKAGRIQMGSGNVIKILSTGSFQIYNDSSSDATFTGIANDSQLPTKFYYWALPDTTGSKLTLTGGGYFAGAIYAYYQNVVLTGGSSGNVRDFYGALVANTVVNSGHFYMSYDQALGGSGSAGMVATGWREL